MFYRSNEQFWGIFMFISENGLGCDTLGCLVNMYICFGVDEFIDTVFHRNVCRGMKSDDEVFFSSLFVE